MKTLKAIILSVIFFVLTVPAFSQTAYRIKTYASLPAACNPLTGDIVNISTSISTGALYICSGSGTWTALGGVSGILTASQPFTETQTWNNGAVTFQGNLINITNTASAGASTLFDYQLGGVSTLKLVAATGALVQAPVGPQTASVPAYTESVTWNNAGVTFHNWILNVTPTAFTTPSYLFELQNTGADVFAVDQVGNVKANSYADNSECLNGAQPAACGAATAGDVAMVNGTSTLIVNTTAVTANSVIQVVQDNSIGAQVGKTCTATGIPLMITARTAGTSFTIGTSTGGNVAANYECITFTIRN